MCFLDKAFQIWYSNDNGLSALKNNVNESKKDALWLSEKIKTTNVGGYLHLLVTIDLLTNVIEKNALKNGVPPILVLTRKKNIGRINNIRSDVTRGALKYWGQWLKKRRRRFEERLKQIIGFKFKPS